MQDNKSPEMSKWLNDFTMRAYGRKRDGSCCVTCGSDKVKPKDFKDELSKKEFGISFMCQKCQDGVFNVDE